MGKEVQKAKTWYPALDATSPALDLQEPLLFYSCCYEDLRFRQSAECAHSNLRALEGMLNRQLARVALLSTLADKVGFESTQHA